MTLRGVLREFRDFPATTFFCAIWIVVFIAMVIAQRASGVSPSWMKLLVVGIGDGHRFGDLTINDIARGEYWRLITSTFIHFSVIHLVLNLVAMYQLGTMVESWYGSPQSVFLYAVTGGGGNLVSVAIRYLIGSNPLVHSGGGSVVIMGIVGLCAVAGLRSRTKTGVSLGWIMVFFIGLTAVIGYTFAQFIDNWGHAGGALVGAVLGFRHRAFLDGIAKPTAWGRGILAAVVMVACGVAQARVDRRDAPAREERAMLKRVAAFERDYHLLSRADALARQHATGDAIVGLLESITADSAVDHLPPDELHQLSLMAQSAAGRPLTPDEGNAFRQRLMALLDQSRRDYSAERKRLSELRDALRLRQVR